MANRDQKAVGPWIEVARETFPRDRDHMDPNYDEDFTIVVERGNMHEGRSNHTYVGGAYKVWSPDKNVCRKKTFIGEMAWAQAQRYATDTATSLTRGIGAVFAFNL